MGYRSGDPVVTFEAKIEHKAPKSYLVEMTLGGRYFVPFSQIVSPDGTRTGAEYIGEPDEYGNREFTVTEWWWNVKEEVE